MAAIDILMLMLLSSSALVVDGVDKYGCYSPSESPCTNTTLSCKAGEVIAVEDLRHKITLGNTKRQCKDESQCDSNDCCRARRGDIQRIADIADRQEVYKKCSHMQSCTVVSPFNKETNHGYVKYVYFCLKDLNTINIYENVARSVNEDIFIHLAGKSGSQSPRCCKFISSKPISIESLYINLSKETCKMIASSSRGLSLFNCTEDRFIMLSEVLTTEGDKQIDMNNMFLKDEDIIWIHLKRNDSSKFINVSCSTCNSRSASASLTGVWITVMVTCILLMPIIL